MSQIEEQLHIFKGGDKSQDFYGAWNKHPVIEAEESENGRVEIAEEIGKILLVQTLSD